MTVGSAEQALGRISDGFESMAPFREPGWNSAVIPLSGLFIRNDLGAAPLATDGRQGARHPESPVTVQSFFQENPPIAGSILDPAKAGFLYLERFPATDVN